MKMNGQFLEARADAAALLQPAHALLDHRALAIGLLVKLHRRIPPRRLGVLVRDHRADALLLDPVADAPRAIGFVSGQLAGLFAASLLPGGDERGHQRLEARRFVHLTGAELEGQRSSLAVRNQMEFGSKPASAAAQSVVGRFVGVSLETFLSAPAAARAARTLLPSTHHRSQSIRPCWSSLIWRDSMMRAKTPFLRQLRKWWYTVCQGPKRSGRSRQDAPVTRIQKMALSRVRRSLAGRPVRALLAGKCGSTNAHCSSVSSWRFISGDLHVVTAVYRFSEVSDRA